VFNEIVISVQRVEILRIVGRHENNVVIIVAVSKSSIHVNHLMLLIN